MSKTIFISCGQFTQAERRLGKQIADMVRDLTDCVPFFAEEVQDLNGLDANILGALRDCVGFITVMHPRGEIKRPDGSVLMRASVWIEQEIAIATYIQRFEHRPLPIIAFKHKSVSREGIRDLLHLNPVEFTDERDVLAELPKRLASWRSLKPSGIDLRLISEAGRQESGHSIRQLETILINETNNRIDHYELEIRIPSSLLKHFNYNYPNEKQHNVPGLRCFRFDQTGFGSARPHDHIKMATFEYCTACAGAEHGVGALVAEAKVGARIWVDGNEYAVEKTIRQLAEERDERR
jgi:hypothetical protein